MFAPQFRKKNTTPKMKKFEFNAPIVSRRKIKKLNVLTGLAAAALLGYFGLTYLEYGYIPIIHKIIAQIGLLGWSSWIYLGLFVGLLMPVLSTIRMFSSKKVKVGGVVSFDEETLKIVKGKDEYAIPQADLKEIKFELKALPDPEKRKEKEETLDLVGGSYMKIPTPKGTFICELDINEPIQREKLLDMAEFLKIEHDVVVKVKE